MTNQGTDNLIDECCHLEITQKFVSPTGKVFDYTYNNNNNWFCVTPDMKGTWKYYLEINGDYNTDFSGSFEVVSKTDFQYKRDNWSFDNSGDNFTHDKYYLNSNDASQLLKGLSIIEKARITFSRYSDWHGSCYGMTALATLVKAGEVSSNRLPGNPSNLYKAANPNKNYNIESAINYYQLLQDTEVIQQVKAAYSRLTQSEIIREMIAINRNNDCNITPFLLGFSGTFWGTDDGGHAIMVYDCKKGNYTWNSLTYDTMFVTYDPNSTVHDECRCLYVNSSNNSWCIPSYMLGSNWNNGRLSYIITGYDTLNYHGLYERASVGGRIASGNYYAILRAAAMKSNVSITKLNQSSGSLGNSTISSDDEITVFYDVFGEDITKATLNAVLPQKDADYVFKTDKSDNYNLQMSYENLAYFVEADNGKKVTFSPEGSCRLDSAGGRCAVNAVYNNAEKCPLSWSNVKIESNDTGYVQLNEKYGMFLIESQSLNDCSVSSVTDYDTLSNVSINFSSNGQKAYIYQKNGKVAAQVVGDLNGDYKISVSDAVILQKWLLGQETKMPEIWQAADLCEDERIDVFDFCLLKRLLIENS